MKNFENTQNVKRNIEVSIEVISVEADWKSNK